MQEGIKKNIEPDKKRLKIILIVKGFMQVEGVNYNKNFITYDKILFDKNIINR